MLTSAGVLCSTVAIGVGAQSTLGEDSRHFCPKNMYEKLTKCPNFTWFLPKTLSKYPNFMILARKINKIPKFYEIFARKWPNFT